MTSRNIKKSKKWNFFLFFINIKKIIIYTFFSFYLTSYQYFQILKTYLSYVKNLAPFHVVFKHLLIVLILFYYIFQLIIPNGFLCNYIKKYRKYLNLKSDITTLKERQFYTTNTLKVIEEEKEDTIEELIINNVGKQIKNRKYLYLEENNKENSD